jgi:hypothetical protein
MLDTMARRKKAAARDSIEQLELPLLWPDRDGLLTLPQRSAAPSSGWSLRDSQLSPRGEVARASRYLRSQYLWSWLSLKNSEKASYIGGSELRFGDWLSSALQAADFCALPVWRVVDAACDELRIDKWQTLRFILRLTGRGARFKSESGLITFR